MRGMIGGGARLTNRNAAARHSNPVGWTFLDPSTGNACGHLEPDSRRDMLSPRHLDMLTAKLFGALAVLAAVLALPRILRPSLDVKWFLTAHIQASLRSNCGLWSGW